MKYRYTPLQIEKINTIKWLKSDAAQALKPEKHGLNHAQLAEMEAAIQGKIVYPGSPDYNTDRLDFNNVYPAFPLMIVYVANYQDIRECLKIVRETGIECSIRSGGHSLAGYSVCDGMVIDISGLKSVLVDYESKTAIVEAGNTFGDLNPKFEFYGLHMPGGGCPTVSVAGFMQGGGYGMTSRIFGINSDCVLEVTIMLADGKVVVANDKQNEDLFWAVRGGTGGNFGVLLQIKYQLFELGDIWGARLTWSFQDDCTNAAQALYTIQELYLKGFQVPNMGMQTVLCTEFTDNPKEGEKMVYSGICFNGSEQEFDAALAPLLAVPGATLAFKKQGMYSEINELVLQGIPNVPQDVSAYSRSTYIGRSLEVEEYISIMNFFKTAPNNYALVDMEGYGGVINQYPVEKSAFIHRNVTMDFFCDAFFNKETNDQKQNEVWINGFFEFMKQFGNGHSYQNYPNRDQENFRWAYWGVYYNQLLAVKTKYNPGNIFRYQQSIGEMLPDEYNQQQIMIFTNTPIHYENY